VVLTAVLPLINERVLNVAGTKGRVWKEYSGRINNIPGLTLEAKAAMLDEFKMGLPRLGITDSSRMENSNIPFGVIVCGALVWLLNNIGWPFVQYFEIEKNYYFGVLLSMLFFIVYFCILFIRLIFGIGRSAYELYSLENYAKREIEKSAKRFAALFYVDWVNRSISQVQGAVNGFKEKNGHWPACLPDLISSGMIADIPGGIVYDSTTGIVSSNQ